MTWLADPVTPVALLTLGFVAFRAMALNRVDTASRSALAACAAVLVAGVVTYQLKTVFGRTWPETWVNNNPSYFGNGTYGFFPFHGGQGWASFPSGHMTAISSFAGAMWFFLPRLKWVGVIAILIVGVGLLGADFHWLSDEAGGCTVGFGCAWIASRLTRPA
jgi:membrane-associated phospholipid phosphatase